MISIKDEDKGRIETAVALLRTHPWFVSKEQIIDELTIVLTNIKELMQEQPYPRPRLAPSFCKECSRSPELCMCGESRN